jgi:hypothetical protein
VNVTTVGKLAQDREAALSCGAAVFDLATARGSTRQAFFDAVRAALPLDPPLVRSQSWDALSDSVWGGLDSLDTRTIVITWRELQRSRTWHPRNLKSRRAPFMTLRSASRVGRRPMANLSRSLYCLPSL